MFRPALELRIVFGQNVNEWSFEASTLPDLAASNYELTNEALTFSDGRVLWEDDPIRLIFSVTLDRPGTWSLNMRGASFLKLDVPWSLDAALANLDEPSSTTQPVQTDFEDVHRGALVGADHDCWAFEVETHEVLRLLVEWAQVPIEIEQPHPVPDLITAAGLSPLQKSWWTTTANHQITYRWRALPTGLYPLHARSPIKFSPIPGRVCLGMRALVPRTQVDLLR